MSLLNNIRGISKIIGVNKITPSDILRSKILAKRVESMNSIRFVYDSNLKTDYNENLKFIEYLNESISYNPKNEEAFFLRAICKACNYTQLNGAMNDVDTILNLNPENADAHTLKGLVHYKIEWVKNSPPETSKEWSKEKELKTIEKSILYIDDSLFVKPNNVEALRAKKYLIPYNSRERRLVINQLIQYDEDKGVHYYDRASLNKRFNKDDKESIINDLIKAADYGYRHASISLSVDYNINYDEI